MHGAFKTERRIGTPPPFLCDAAGLFIWYRCFYLLRSREFVSPVCGICLGGPTPTSTNYYTKVLRGLQSILIATFSLHLQFVRVCVSRMQDFFRWSYKYELLYKSLRGLQSILMATFSLHLLRGERSKHALYLSLIQVNMYVSITL